MDRALPNLFGGIGDAVFGDGGKNKGILGGLLGGIFGKKAQGGPVTGGRSYIVGERGPEVSHQGGLVTLHQITSLAVQ